MAIASGTSSTICDSATTQTWRSGTSVSARLPSAGPPASTIVPVSAIATRAAGEHAVEPVELGRREPVILDELEPSGRHAAGAPGGIADAPCAARFERLGDRSRRLGASTRRTSAR